MSVTPPSPATPQPGSFKLVKADPPSAIVHFNGKSYKVTYTPPSNTTLHSTNIEERIQNLALAILNNPEVPTFIENKKSFQATFTERDFNVIDKDATITDDVENRIRDSFTKAHLEFLKPARALDKPLGTLTIAELHESPVSDSARSVSANPTPTSSRRPSVSSTSSVATPELRTPGTPSTASQAGRPRSRSGSTDSRDPLRRASVSSSSSTAPSAAATPPGTPAPHSPTAEPRSRSGSTHSSPPSRGAHAPASSHPNAAGGARTVSNPPGSSQPTVIEMTPINRTSSPPSSSGSNPPGSGSGK